VFSLSLFLLSCFLFSFPFREILHCAWETQGGFQVMSHFSPASALSCKSLQLYNREREREREGDRHARAADKNAGSDCTVLRLPLIGFRDENRSLGCGGSSRLESSRVEQNRVRKRSVVAGSFHFRFASQEDLEREFSRATTSCSLPASFAIHPRRAGGNWKTLNRPLRFHFRLFGLVYVATLFSLPFCDTLRQSDALQGWGQSIRLGSVSLEMSQRVRKHTYGRSGLCLHEKITYILEINARKSIISPVALLPSFFLGISALETTLSRSYLVSCSLFCLERTFCL